MSENKRLRVEINSPNKPKLLRMNDIAKELGIGLSTAWKWHKEGKLLSVMQNFQPNAQYGKRVILMTSSMTLQTILRVSLIDLTLRRVHEPCYICNGSVLTLGIPN